MTDEDKVRRRIEERIIKRRKVIGNTITYILVGLMMVVIWIITANVFHGIFEQPWFFIVWFGLLIAAVTEWFDYYGKYGGGADRLEQEVQRELARLRERGVLDVDEAAVRRAKRKNEDDEDDDDRHARLADDGELTDSYIQSLEERDRARRSRGSR